MNKSYLRSVARIAVAGTILAGAQLSGPAAVAAAPQLTDGATLTAAQAPGTVSTTTTLTVRRETGRFGARNGATAEVTSDAGVPTGSVRFRIVGVGTFTAPTADGVATATFPRRLRAGTTYEVIARYLPTEGSEFEESSSESGFYTVKRRGTSTEVVARDIVRRHRPVVDVAVVASNGRGPSGRVRVSLFRNGEPRETRVVRLGGNGEVRLRFPRVDYPGRWSATVDYLGNNNYRRSTGADDFRIRR